METNDRTFNNGHVIIGNNKKKIRLNIQFGTDEILISTSKKTFFVKPSGTKYYVKGDNDIVHAAYDNFKMVFSHICKVPEKKLTIISSQLTIKGIPFTLYLLSNGVMLKLEIEFCPQTFIIMDTLTGVLIAHREGEWEKPVITDRDVLQNCRNYNEAMFAIHNHCKANIDALVSLPNIIN